MSDVFYSAQYRDMHTAIHHLAIFSLEEKAQEFIAFVEEHERVPSEEEFSYEPLNFIVDVEIDHRDPLQYFEEIRLVYVNFDKIPPDAY